MGEGLDDEFLELADAHIELSNDQLSETRAGRVSAAMLYGTARFNIWLTARGCDTAEDMETKREETIAYYVKSYQQALTDHFDDYVGNFADYMMPENKDA